MESSTIDDPPKLLPISTKVGKDPVVIPLIRCNVVVGGSAYELKMQECLGLFFVSSWGRVKILWWKGDTGLGGLGDTKSNRRASIIRNTARLCLGETSQF